MPFQWPELIVYLLPVAMLWLIMTFRSAFPAGEGELSLLPVDLMHPTLWVCFHILTERSYYYSLLPIYGLVVCLVGLAFVFRTVQKGETFRWGKFWRFASNLTFAATFLIYYFFVLLRIIHLLVA